ncbi:MAG: DNA-directed RNA polymerase subunit omega [Acetobacteraceae bacterium]|nr:DNA-directed RNA polymerase subunit omega [Acetobacteraceae bacterium]
MLEPSLDALVKKVDSKYTLVVAAAKRARELVDGKQPSIEAKSTQPVTIALEEISQGQIKLERPRAGIK